MSEQDARQSESAELASGAPATPRVSGEVSTNLADSDTPQPESNMRPAQLPDEPAVVSLPGDTLLSAGKPADRLELMLEDRFGTLEDRLRQIDSRLAMLEQKKSMPPPEPRQKPWLWIAFLIGLVVVFQLLRYAR
ncbi:MAG TPA: hypothetical protein VJN18_20175 [Polyangiaceae bacterium]|nr:hypothetical protein [Polyangiaceae bacterium]